MTIRLTLICAASTDALQRGAFPDDEPVDARGLAGALEAAGKLRWSDHILASPARRATETAQALGLIPVIDPALDECDYGTWRGRDLAEIHAEDPAGVAAWIADPGAAPHGGESLIDLTRRMAAFLDLQLRDTGHVIAITHPAVIRAAVIHAIGAPPQSFWRIDIGPLSKTDLRGNNDRWTLRSCGCDLLDGPHM